MIRQPSLFAQHHKETGWTAPETYPVLDDRFKRAGVDFETDGTDTHGSSVPIGLAVALEDGRDFYFPWGHAGGGNLDKGRTIEWANKELAGKELAVAEGKFEVHMGRKIDLDFERIGCKLREVQYKAALLDDTRRSFKLGDLASDYLGRGKLDIERDKIWELPASQVGSYAELDARLTLDLDQYFSPLLAKENLTEVAQLEDDIIYAICEMERNGARLDMPKLRGWSREIASRRQKAVYRIHEQVGLRVNPDSAKDLEVLFGILGLGYAKTETGLGSFTDKFLSGIDHECIKLVREARTLGSLDSKYVGKYLRAVSPEGILWFKLHQLKGDDYGTISGRFSSSSVNIQQVFDPERQIEKYGSAEFLIRELFIPEDGMWWCKADASQIEFRLFCHYANSAKLIEAYRRDPYADFHEKVAEIMRRRLPGFTRKKGKNINFGKVYGMGRGKMATQLDLPQHEADDLFDAYDAEFPEVKTLLNKAMKVAEQRGYVKTHLGRRAWFRERKRLHSALNRVIQGTAADVLKLKLRDLYRERHNLGIHKLRFTVHDEFDADLYNQEDAVRVREFLDQQVIPFKVPLLWDVKVGRNWAEAA